MNKHVGLLLAPQSQAVSAYRVYGLQHAAPGSCHWAKPPDDTARMAAILPTASLGPVCVGVLQQLQCHPHRVNAPENHRLEGFACGSALCNLTQTATEAHLVNCGEEDGKVGTQRQRKAADGV